MSVSMVSIPVHEIGKDKMYNIWHRIEGGAELMLVLQGSGSLVLKEKVYPLVRGGLYYIAHGTLHYTLPNDPKHYDRIKMLVGTPVISADREIARFLGEKEAVFAQLPEEKIKKARALFDVISSTEEVYMKNAESFASTLNLLVMLCRFGTEGENASGDVISALVSHMNEHISEELGMDALCDAVHASKSHLCRIFKKRMGITIMEYIAETRIELAKEMLRTEPETLISEVSDRCGFSNVSYFCAVFKKKTGVSPLTYKKGCQIES